MSALQFDAILPRRFDPGRFFEEFKTAGRGSAKLWRSEFQKTTRTWETVHPVFKIASVQNESETIFDTSTNNVIYKFLNDGTKLRYAVMDFLPPFQAKTSVGFIGSRAGQGGKSHMDFNYQRALSRRIEARKWDVAIAKKTLPFIVKRFEFAMRKGAKASGHGY